MCKVEKRWVEAKIEREWKTETLTWQVRQTVRQAGRQAGKVSAFIHTNYKFNLTLIFFVLQWLLPSYHLWNFWAQPAWWVVLHFLLMITHCQCFLPTVFLSLSISLSFSLLYHSFYFCSPFSVRVGFFFPRFLYTSSTSLSLKSLLEVSVEFVGFISLHLLLPCSSLCPSLSIRLLCCVLKSTCTKMYISLAITWLMLMKFI